MPTVGIHADELCKELNMDYSDPHKAEKEFEELCFAYGLELDEVTSKRIMEEKEKGAEYVKEHLKEYLEQHGDNFEKTLWKVDIPANRYDLLCIEGLTRALRTYKQVQKAPTYQVIKPEKPEECTIQPEVAHARPYFVMAVLKDITFTKESYDSFIELQDRLHQNIGRRRQLVSIGTHDADTLQGPFTYEALKPEEINFVPLKDPYNKSDDGKHSYDARTLLEGYKQHPQLKAYVGAYRVPLIFDKPKWPVIYDKNRTLLSLPPIINSWHSKISLNTKNVLIDITAEDYTKCNIVLNTVCAMFSQHCKKPFSVEQVLMKTSPDYPSGIPFMTAGEEKLYPTMPVTKFEVDSNRMKRNLNLEHLSTKEVQDLLEKMMLPSVESKPNSGLLNVQVPCTRSDIMHEVDIIEDLAIAHGYDNLKHVNPEMSTMIRDQPTGKITDFMRHECAGAGFNEAYNFALLSKEDCFLWMRREFGTGVRSGEGEYVNEFEFDRVHRYLHNPKPVTLSNPKAKEYNMVRTTLLPGLLKSMEHNKKNPLPIRLFEVSDVVVQDAFAETGARNQRRVAAAVFSQESTFEVIHGLLDHLMYKLNVRPAVEIEEERLRNEKLGVKDAKSWTGFVYEMKHISNPSFLEGMCGEIIIRKLGKKNTNGAVGTEEGLPIGIAGVLRPDVLDPAPVEIPSAASAGDKGEGEVKDKTVIRAPWSIKAPCACMEFNLSPFMAWREMSPVGSQSD